MWRLLKMAWLPFFNQSKVARPTNRAVLRDKAVVVAGRVSFVKAGKSWKGSCPICFEVICGQSESDIQMILALHLSLWHPDDVQWQWDIMQKKKKDLLHLPSIAVGLGIAAAVGALLAFASKNQVPKSRPVFKLR